MKLHEYFYPQINLTHIDGVEVKSLNLVAEIQLIELWSDFEIELKNQEASEASIKEKFIELALIATNITNKQIKKIKSNKDYFAWWLLTVKQRIVDNVLNVLQDNESNGFFQKADGSKPLPETLKSNYVNLINYILINYGYDTLNNITLNQAYILRRTNQIAQIENREDKIYDTLYSAIEIKPEHRKEYLSNLKTVSKTFQSENSALSDKAIASYVPKKFTDEELADIHEQAKQELLSLNKSEKSNTEEL